MRILSLLYVYFLVLDSKGSVSVPEPEDVKVVSNNFIHILQWSPGKGTQTGTVYKVEVRYDQSRIVLISHSGTSLDISKYMKDIHKQYQIKLWATFGNSLSSDVVTYFTPLTDTTIGPPILSLSGCGDCLNISINLPNRQSAPYFFYQAISFSISWWKDGEKQDNCRRPNANHLNQGPVGYSYKLKHLLPGERYCVEVTPQQTSLRNVQSSCSCEYTSRVEPRGVAFLVGCVLSSVLVGLCFLGFMFGLIFTGVLCKPKVRLPKALIILVPGSFLSPEDMSISVAEVEYGIEIHKLKDNKKEKANIHDVDEDDEEDEEGHHAYMVREGPKESESAESTSVYNVSDLSESSGFEDAPRDTSETTSLVQIQHDEDEGYGPAGALVLLTENSNPQTENEKKKITVKIKEEEEEDDHCGNVNLWSVVLKSMQPEEEKADDQSEAQEPLLPLILRGARQDSLSAAKPQTGSSLELHSALLFHEETELQSDQEDEHDVSDTSVCERMRTGYMASHRGTIGTENCSSEDEDCTSDYMTR